VNVERFLADRRPVWQQLDELLARGAESELSREEMHELTELYRRTCSDLNRARIHTANADVIGYLNQLTGRGYRYIYQAAHEQSVWRSFVQLVAYEIPFAFRRERNWMALAALAFLAGTLFGALAVAINPANGRRLIPPMFFTESPGERVAKIESGEERIDKVEEAMYFGASLYSHNIKVSFLAFSLGALTIVFGLWILFYNGVSLGAIAVMYILDDVPMFFFSWVGPHGALELPSIIFAGGAGLLAGRALLMPGDLSRAASLRRVLPSVWRIIIGASMTLVLAGIIEGSFSQFSQKTIAYELKILVAVLLFVALMVWLFARRLPEER
jgi:uncharacterized membrane protein SpoIIM required for sporulation